MIVQAESDLNQTEYDELDALGTPGTYEMTLQRLNHLFTYINGSASDVTFDAGAASNCLVRSVWDGSDFDLEISTGAAWSNLGSVSGWTEITAVHANPATAVCSAWFYNSGTGSISRKRSTDGGLSYSGLTHIATLSNVQWLAPVSDDKIHIVTYANNRSRFHFLEDDGGWSRTDSDLYIPHALDSFDAETLGDRDVLVFGSDGPTRYTDQRNGIWALHERNGRWGGITEVDVVDEKATVSSIDGYGYYHGQKYRQKAKLSIIDDKLWVTYEAMDTQKFTSYSVSSDGIYWQLRQRLHVPTATWPAKLLLWSDTIYMVSAETLHSSDSTPLNGGSGTNTVVTDSVKKYGANRGQIHQTTLELHNDDGAFDSLLDDHSRYQIKEELGYYDASGNKLTQTVALTEIDRLTIHKTPGLNMVSISARDRMAWMSDRVRAEHFETWEGQITHFDDFVTMAHTAILAGEWGVHSDGYLQVDSNSDECFALCTVDPYIRTLAYQTAFRVYSTQAGHYAGLIFRASADAEDCFCAYYESNADELRLRARSGGSWSGTLDSLGSMGWGISAYYWIRVEAVGQQIKVYYADYDESDPHEALTWTLAFTYVDTTYGFEEGYVGLAALGAGYHRFKTRVLFSGDHTISVEDSFRMLGAYAGIHEFAFEDYDLDWNWGEATGTWSDIGNNQIQGTGDGGTEWYWMDLTTHDDATSHTITLKKTGTRGAVTFIRQPDVLDPFPGDWYIWWDSSNIGLSREDGASTYIMNQLPKDYSDADVEITISVHTEYDGSYYVCIWFDGEYAISSYMGLSENQALMKIQLGVYGSDTVTFSDIRIPDLYDELPVVTLDAGETPLNALERALSTRHVHFDIRFDGSLRAIRPGERDSVKTINIDTGSYRWTETRDKRRLFSHYKLVGAYDAWEAYNNLSNYIGHKFLKEDDGELIFWMQCLKAVFERIHRFEEQSHTAQLTFPFSPFLEPQDIITVDSSDWAIAGWTVTLAAGSLSCVMELMEYVYG